MNACVLSFCLSVGPLFVWENLTSRFLSDIFLLSEIKCRIFFLISLIYFYSCLLTFAITHSEPYLALRTCFAYEFHRKPIDCSGLPLLVKIYRMMNLFWIFLGPFLSRKSIRPLSRPLDIRVRIGSGFTHAM